MGLPEPIYHDEWVTLIQGDAVTLLPEIPAASIQLIVVDPPYFKAKLDYLGKRLEWDRQWPTRDAYLAWLRQLAKEWQRILAPNGSLYCFAAPSMAAHVEVMLEDYFTVLNRIRWRKEEGWHQKACKEELRSYLSPWEEILFCEQRNADAMALGESGYAAQCNHLHGHIFEPIRAYLDGERRRASINFEQVRQAVGCASGSGLPSHWFTRSQWELPLAKHYASLQTLFNTSGRRPAPPFTEYHLAGSSFVRFHTAADYEYLRADYDALRADYDALRANYDALRANYDALRANYDALRRPFTVTDSIPYTNVWDFATVPAQAGKHAAEKPLPMLRHMIEVSSRPGDLVLDCCAGSASTLEAARQCGRKALGIELEASSCQLGFEQLCQQTLGLF